MNKEQSSLGSDQIEMVSTPAFARPASTSGHTPWEETIGECEETHMQTMVYQVRANDGLSSWKVEDLEG